MVQSNSNQIIEKDPIAIKAKKRKTEQTERIVIENDLDQNLETDEKTVDKQNLKKKKSSVSEKNMDVLPVTRTDSKKKEKNKSEDGQLNATSNKTTLKRKIPICESVSEDDLDDSGQQIKKPKKPQTLTETGFQWDVKLEDLNKPVEESVENEDEVSISLILILNE